MDKDPGAARDPIAAPQAVMVQEVKVSSLVSSQRPLPAPRRDGDGAGIFSGRLETNSRVDAAHKACFILKACRYNWLSADEIGALVDSRGDRLMAWLIAMQQHGLLVARYEPQGKPGRVPRVFKVAPEWRNEG